MKAIVDGFEWIIEFFKTIGNIITSLFEMNMKMTQIGIKIMQLTANVILNMPSWLQIFATLTLTVSLLYIILGRNVGKSD